MDARKNPVEKLHWGVPLSALNRRQITVAKSTGSILVTNHTINQLPCDVESHSGHPARSDALEPYDYGTDEERVKRVCVGMSVRRARLLHYLLFGVEVSSIVFSQNGHELNPNDVLADDFTIAVRAVGGGRKKNSSGKKQARSTAGMVGGAGGAVAATAMGNPELAPLMALLGSQLASGAVRKAQPKSKAKKRAEITGSGAYKLTGGGSFVTNSLFSGTSAPTFGDNVTKSLSGVRVKHRDCIGDLIATGEAWSVESFDIDPTSRKLLPFTSVSGENYNKYRVHGIAFEYVPLISTYSSTTSMGMVGMLASTNPNQSTFNNLTSFLNSFGAVSAVPYQGIMYGMECAEGTRPTEVLFTRDPYTAQQAVVDGVEVSGVVSDNWTDLGVLQVAQSTVGYEPGTVMGELFCTLDIEWLEPRVSPATYGMFIQQDAALNYCWDGAPSLINPTLTSEEWTGTNIAKAGFGSLSDAYLTFDVDDILDPHSPSQFIRLTLPSLVVGDLVSVTISAVPTGGQYFVTNYSGAGFSGTLEASVSQSTGMVAMPLAASASDSGMVFALGASANPAPLSAPTSVEYMQSAVMLCSFVYESETLTPPWVEFQFPAESWVQSSPVIANIHRVVQANVISNGVASADGTFPTAVRGKKVTLAKKPGKKKAPITRQPQADDCSEDGSLCGVQRKHVLKRGY